MNGDIYSYSWFSILTIRVTAGWFICDLYMVFTSYIDYKNFTKSSTMALPYIVHGGVSFMAYFLGLV